MSESYHIYVDDTNATGWTCPQCGAWVDYGKPHNCYPPQEAQPFHFMPPDYSRPLDRIAAALERIAAILEGVESPDG